MSSNTSMQQQSQSKNSATLENIKVLVAEDDPVNMIIASKILESKKANVSKAHNGEEALQMLGDKHDFDLVLLDLEMPELSGYLAIAKIKEKYPTLPVIAFTANLLDKETRASLMEIGFTDCISKPFIPETFYNRIYSALGMIITN